MENRRFEREMKKNQAGGLNCADRADQGTKNNPVPFFLLREKIGYFLLGQDRPRPLLTPICVFTPITFFTPINT